MLIHQVIFFLLSALVVLGVSKLLPGVAVRGFGSALAVAGVYSVLGLAANWLLFNTLFAILAIPATVFTLGLFLFALNVFLLWVTDKILDSFEIRGIGNLLLATLLITLGQSVARMIAF